MKHESLPKCTYCDQSAELANRCNAGTFACAMHAEKLEALYGSSSNPMFGPIPDLSFSWRLSFR